MVNRVALSFPERLLRSRLITEEQLAAARSAVNNDEDKVGGHLVREGLLTPFQLRHLRAGATSFQVGKYIVVDCIGRGGNGVVFKARHTLMPNRYVALKTLESRNLHHGDDALSRFRREIDIVARLEHPNVVRAYDVLQTRVHLYLVLEYIAGRDLGTMVRQRGPLPIAEAVAYGVQAARGLAYAHKCGVVHRDLKPANLLLTSDGVVKLSDLGLARFFIHDPDDELTKKGLCLGTPEFMAPEQAEDSNRADHRSDLYSLGATLFHILTGELPVDGISYLHRLQQLLMVPPRPLADARPGVPPGLAAVVDRLRARDPAARPGSAEETIALLEPFARKSWESDPAQWDGRRRAALVLEVLQGRVNAPDACLRDGLAGAEFERWRQRFLEGAEQALDPSSANSTAPAEIIRELHAQIGAQAMEIQALKKRLGDR
jgi:serine/threonine protein kinase